MRNPVALISSLLVQAAMWFAAFISVFPFYWMVVGATNTAVEITGGKASFGTALVENVSKFLAVPFIGRIFLNSAFVAIVGTMLTLAVASLAGYGFEIFRSKTRDKVFGGLLLLLV